MPRQPIWLLNLCVRVGNWHREVENPSPEHRVRVKVKIDNSAPKSMESGLHSNQSEDIRKLTRLVQLLAKQEALDFASRTDNMVTEVSK